MAKHEHDREDLLREATALVRRMELQLPGLQETTFVGFRRDSSASFFLQPDSVLHFNSQRELRRAFETADLIKAERGKLVRLTRNRTEQAVQLVRHELNSDETLAFLKRAEQSLRTLNSRLRANDFQLIGQVPPDGKVAEAVLEWLNDVEYPLAIADTANVR